MLKNEVKKPSYLVGSRLGSILGDFLRKLGDFFSKSSGHTDKFTSWSELLQDFIGFTFRFGWKWRLKGLLYGLLALAVLQDQL